MKILYVTNNDGVDYLGNLIFIGLVNNGYEVLDTNYLWYCSQITDEQRLQLYGLAMSIANNLEDRSNIDRSPETILEKIRSHYFDCVIYGSIWRCCDYLEEVLKYYNKNEIAFLDGEDKQDMCFFGPNPCERGVYFKRELTSYYVGALPISFSIPKNKIFNGVCEKSQYRSFITPFDRSTYIYRTEEDYYNDYRKSLYGITAPKAGWDCLRHYEIIANMALPKFENFSDCPKLTMTTWPVDLQVAANNAWIESDRINNFEGRYEIFHKIINPFFNYAYNNLTSEKEANYVIGKLF